MGLQFFSNMQTTNNSRAVSVPQSMLVRVFLGIRKPHLLEGRCNNTKK
jgi:hypothetical protein